MNIYIICPVTHLNANESYKIDAYVKKLEQSGHEVHLPYRDTYQGSIGGGILQCAQNRDAIANADEVHVFWNRTSEGSKFDLGIAFAMRKPIVLINSIKIEPGKKRFENILMLLNMSYKLGVDGKLTHTLITPTWRKR